MSIARKMQMAAAGAAGGWDLANAAFTGTGFIGYDSVTAQESAPQGLFFKPDGTKMYVIGSSGDDVNEYSLSTAWEIQTASFVQTFSIAAQETAPGGLFFKPDGTKMYITGQTGDDVNEYNLSTAWNVSTASFVQIFSVAGQEATPQALFFKDDGTKMYVVGSTGDDVNEYALSTAWDVSTATYTTVFSVSAQTTIPVGISFKSDGTKMYIMDGAGPTSVLEYDLSSAWDVSTASYLQSFNSNLFVFSTSDLFLKPDGTKLFILDSFRDAVMAFDLSVAWDVTTATFQTWTKSLYLIESDATAVYISPNGTKMYILGATGTYAANADQVYEYNLSPAWSIYNASLVQTFSVAAQDTSPTGLFFKDDGTKMYVTGADGDDVNEYSLSTPWDISTASFVQLFSIAALITSPSGLYFEPNGTAMYLIDNANELRYVLKYSMSSAWDISTASAPIIPGRFSVSAQDTTVYGVYIKQDDGTKMYVVGQQNDRVYEYDLGTAWNISTATYVRFFSVSGQETAPSGLFFKDDGTKMYVLGDTGNDVNEYALSTAWNISTATYTTVFSVSTQTTAPASLWFKTDGTAMYTVDTTASNRVLQYTLSTAWDISSATFTASRSVSISLDLTAVAFSSDGTKMFVLDTNEQVSISTLSTAWDVTSASTPTNTTKMFASGLSNATFTFRPDGTQMYMINRSSPVLSFTLSTAWDTTTATFDSGNDCFPTFSFTSNTVYSVYLKPDGTAMYISDFGSLFEEVLQFSLSTPWGLSTASYVQDFDLLTISGVTRGLFFRDTDGKKMYVAGSDLNILIEYDL